MQQVSRGFGWRGGVLGVLLGVLLCAVAGVTPAPVGEAPGATAVVASVPVAVSVSVPVPVSGEDREPGCREKHGDGVGSVPAAPPRSGAAYELLPALYDARAGNGSWGADALVPQPAVDRRPPPRDPPTPIGLSVLRV
ncbi:hypothetical protein J7I98_15865 [Streptomyces sp. ISL-98]|uniref:hypothetical protein n=1 Tax=Streptomyces sp. ISL-98 TaxID=2819192 RepID=UPI001BE8E791|nr:hypothetical protein [Streptomyces sp. ISL-98]MBT2507338.1 hypothetical protein [Streptomyces sp. ISL-98]